MLVIRRRAGERLLIGDQIEIDILELGSAHVKMGIRAPRDVTVLRSEVKLIREQNRSASTVSVETLSAILKNYSSH